MNTEKISRKRKEGFILYKLFKKSKGFDRNANQIPLIVSDSIAALKNRNALGEEGIFRVPGSAVMIKELKNRYYRGKKVDLTNVDTHTIAGLLKVFFRELPEPILTHELYDSFIEAIKAPKLRLQLKYLSKVLEALPPANKKILDLLLEFLKEVSEHKSNCMNAPNIAIVFAPNLIRPKEETIEAILSNSGRITLIVTLLIQFHDFLFCGKKILNEEPSITELNLFPSLISIKEAQKQFADKTNKKNRIDSTAQHSWGNQRHIPPSMNTLEAKNPRNIEEDPNRNNSQHVGRKKGIDSKNEDDSLIPVHQQKSKRRKDRNIISEIITTDYDDDDDSGLKSYKATSSINRKKTPKNEETFYNTLKKGTLKLATNLLEEHELILELAELDKLSPEEKFAVHAKVAGSISKSKKLKDSIRKQRIRNKDNFQTLREIKITGNDQEQGIDKTEEIISDPYLNSSRSNTELTSDTNPSSTTEATINNDSGLYANNNNNESNLDTAATTTTSSITITENESSLDTFNSDNSNKLDNDELKNEKDLNDNDGSIFDKSQNQNAESGISQETYFELDPEQVPENIIINEQYEFIDDDDDDDNVLDISGCEDECVDPSVNSDVDVYGDVDDEDEIEFSGILKLAESPNKLNEDNNNNDNNDDNADNEDDNNKNNDDNNNSDNENLHADDNDENKIENSKLDDEANHRLSREIFFKIQKKLEDHVRIEDLVKSVSEGDMEKLHNFMDELRYMKPLDRGLSKKKLQKRIDINLKSNEDNVDS